MITNEKYLLYILGVNKGQLDYLLAHIDATRQTVVCRAY